MGIRYVTIDGAGNEVMQSGYTDGDYNNEMELLIAS